MPSRWYCLSAPEPGVQLVRRVSRPDQASALRFMQAFTACCPRHGVPLRADGSLQDWKLFAVGQGDGTVTVVIEHRQRAELEALRQGR